jgi:hypothetical protein
LELPDGGQKRRGWCCAQPRGRGRQGAACCMRGMLMACCCWYSQCMGCW